MALEKKVKSDIVSTYGKSDKDTGNIEVQIALCTERIKKLTEHLKKNDKDAIARRGLLIQVGKRKSLLSYLEREDRDAYVKLIAKLGLRK